MNQAIFISTFCATALVFATCNSQAAEGDTLTIKSILGVKWGKTFKIACKVHYTKKQKNDRKGVDSPPYVEVYEVEGTKLKESKNMTVECLQSDDKRRLQELAAQDADVHCLVYEEAYASGIPREAMGLYFEPPQTPNCLHIDYSWKISHRLVILKLLSNSSNK